MRFLSKLLDLLFPVRADEALVRSVAPDAFLRHVSPRPVLYTMPPTTALLPFREKEVRAALHEAKYRGNRKAFELLGRALAEYTSDLDQLERRETVVVPVPLGKSRLRERGYNQVEEILRCAALQSHALLLRVRETASQVSISGKARHENMQGAFAATAPLDPSKLYIIVDDVITTGATMQAAIDALKEAGARHILPIALAH